jgi:hypothetical protein
VRAYQRFLPRDGTRTTARVIAEAAEAAEAAEVKAAQASPAAEALLKPAEVRWRDLRLQQASAKVQQPRTPATLELQQLQQLQQASDPKIAEVRDRDPSTRAQPSDPETDSDSERPGIPTQWGEGVARLTTMPPPRTYPAHAWQQLIVDAERFLEEWAPQAAALGWPGWELFGCHRRAPWGRIQGMGLALMLHGDRLAALTATEAVIRRPSGAHQTRRRRPADPLLAAERCLVWELA